MIICAFENTPFNSKLLGDKDCLHWIWPVKKITPFPFDNQLYHKTKIICKKRVTCKKKQGDFNFAL
jgi:hypothetical protein